MGAFALITFAFLSSDVAVGVFNLTVSGRQGFVLEKVTRFVLSHLPIAVPHRCGPKSIDTIRDLRLLIRDELCIIAMTKPF